MAYLLDTHAVVWAMSEPRRLGRAARRLIEDPTSELLVSAAVAWEIATKERIGKLPEGAALLAGYPRNLRLLGATELPITSEHAILAGRLDWEHRDPFDRVLAAQALVEGLTLMTRDAAFGGLPGLSATW